MEYITAPLVKMRVQASAGRADYQLTLGDATLALNALIGQRITLQFDGRIQCTACGAHTRKSYGQGYCYPCAQRLAECDLCIVSPEKCHYDLGTCRDPAWAKGHCHQDHLIYLANTSGLKVGITRITQVPTRWLDQGATQALPILRVRNRHHAGLVEALLREAVADRTDWRRMLRGDAERRDLRAERDRLLAACAAGLDALRRRVGSDAIAALDENPWEFAYPVSAYPQKVVALGFDKSPAVAGTLLGIKGQYLILDEGVLNVRKHTGYRVKVAA